MLGPPSGPDPVNRLPLVAQKVINANSHTVTVHSCEDMHERYARMFQCFETGVEKSIEIKQGVFVVMKEPVTQYKGVAQ